MARTAPESGDKQCMELRAIVAGTPAAVLHSHNGLEIAGNCATICMVQFHR